MQNKLNIAEVNCDAEPALCRKKGVTGYPTMIL
jgi:thioredoxin domain-containing protein 5